MNSKFHNRSNNAITDKKIGDIRSVAIIKNSTKTKIIEHTENLYEILSLWSIPKQSVITLGDHSPSSLHIAVLQDMITNTGISEYELDINDNLYKIDLESGMSDVL